MEFNRIILGDALELIKQLPDCSVHMVDAADVSRGVAREVEEARRMGKPVRSFWPGEVN